jgi:hypothetical protein
MATSENCELRIAVGAEPSREPERPITPVLQSKLFGGRPVTAVVLSDGRCSVNGPVGIFFQRHDEWFPQPLIFDARCAPCDVMGKSLRSPHRFDPFTLFFIRGSVLPSVGSPHSKPPSVRHGVSDVPVSHGRIPRA